MSIFPSENTWITPRTKDVKITTDNCMLILPKKISHIEQVYLNANSFALWNLKGSDGLTHKGGISLSNLSPYQNMMRTISVLDIGKYVVEKAKYDTLDTYTAIQSIPWGEIATNNAWFYSHNETDIQCINSRPNVFSDNVFYNIVEFAIVDCASINGALYYNDNGTIIKFSVNSIKDSFSSSVSRWPSLLTAQFRIVYVPLGESVKLQVPKTNPQENEFHIPFSQQQPIVNNLTIGREMQSLANRTGCEIKQVVRTFTSISQYRKPGAFWREKDANGNLTGNVWRLTSTNLQIYSDSLFRCTETWSKNWSLRSENVPINREFRSWNIPADIVQRNLLWNDYCLVSDKTLTVPDDAIISPSAVEQLVLALKSGTPSIVFQNECSLTWFYTIKNTPRQTKQGAVLSCASFGFGNSLVFSSKTKDNLSAGMQRVPADDNDTDYQLCRDVYYCNSDGTLESMYIQIAGESASNDTQFYYAYPEYSDNGTTAVNAPPLNDEKLFKDGMQFKVLKDPAEQLNFTYQLHLITDNPNLVIGSAWASYNPLVKKLSQGISVKTWLLTSYLPAGAKVMTSAYGRMAPANDATVKIIVGDYPGIGFVFTQAQISSGVVGVCITDNNNNVMLAYNSNVSTTFSLYVTHFYANIYAALRQLQLQEQQQTDNQ